MILNASHSALEKARAAYDEWIADGKNNEEAREKLAAGLKVGGELGFKMLDAWDPSLKVHEKFSVQVKDGDTGFAALEGAFTV